MTARKTSRDALNDPGAVPERFRRCPCLLEAASETQGSRRRWIKRGELFRSRGFQEMAVRAGEGDFEPFTVQEQGTREMDGIGTPKRMALAEPGHERQHLGSERYSCEPLPVVGKSKPGLFELGGQQKLFAPSTSKRRMDLGEGQVGDGRRCPA